MSAPNNTGSSSLRPAWYKGTGGGGGRGFQPPPTVTSDRGDKARSSSWGSQEPRDSNKFSALQDDEDGPAPFNGKSDQIPSNSRSEAFRSSFSRSSSTGTGAKAGRSLADLAASVPEAAPTGRRNSSGYDRSTGRFPNARPPEAGGAPGAGGSIDAYKPDPKVIRFTREKLLSMRAPPKGDEEPPGCLTHLEGAVIISKTPQDPVCWDTFDGEEIWELSRERRLSGTGTPKPTTAGPPRLVAEPPEDPRRARNAPSSGRWKRGVALPPPEESGRRKERDAENPNELWDDPVGGAIGAASDFSAFGAMPNDDNAFDFEKMAENTKKLDEELHGTADVDPDDEDQQHPVKVDPSRPLASAGMTITSGSGDDVNVFEDFDAPSAEQKALRAAATEDPSASSRLMKMIGVTKDTPETANGNQEPSSNPWGAPVPGDTGASAVVPIIGSLGGVSLGGVPLNPWGAPVGSTSAPPPADGGMDLAARLEVLANEQKSREAADMENRAQEAEMLRRRQEEEGQRMAMQRQAEDQARQQQAQVAAMQQQQSTQQSQVELVLMERIGSILENSWGRSDLVSILTTLHSEDSRVIPLLGNVDALRALLARSPQRIALRRDPNFAGDMAVLQLTNAQWQQQVQARLQQEELQRRRMEEEAARAEVQNRVAAQINPDLPWFYSDPQNNIQGPFRGEEMRQWLEAGYFKGDLPISQQTSGPFLPLSALFPDLSVAFRAVADDNTAQEEAEKKAAEEEQRRKEAEEEERRAAEAAARAEAEKREADERDRVEKERQAAADAEAVAAEEAKASSSGNESSTQLKLMLGLSSDEQIGDEVTAAQEAFETPIPSKKQPTEKRGSKGEKKKSQHKPVEEAPVQMPVEEALLPAKSAAVAWGGVGNAKPKKSMSEIQQEEARAAAVMATQREGIPRQSSSGWANVAATGKAGWGSGTLKQASAGAPNANAAPNARPAPTRANAPTAQAPTARQASPITQQQRQSSTASSSTPAEEFGATMSPVLEKWCKEQMQKINGSDDLTLVAFCMTLNDANEIRQYLTTYLGSTPQVNNFATEFITKRGLGNRQEEWETPGSAKKGRKKKAAGR